MEPTAGKVECRSCGAKILRTTAERNAGLCEPCARSRSPASRIGRVALWGLAVAVAPPALVLAVLVGTVCVSVALGEWVLRRLFPSFFFRRDRVRRAVLEFSHPIHGGEASAQIVWRDGSRWDVRVLIGPTRPPMRAYYRFDETSGEVSERPLEVGQRRYGRGPLR